MLSKNQALIMMPLLVAIVLLIGLAGNRIVAQDSAAQDMQAMLTNLTRSGATVTILFDRPLISGEGVWTLPDAGAQRTIAEVGADYVCFSEPWNNTTQNRCTPFSNITSVSYVK